MPGQRTQTPAPPEGTSERDESAPVERAETKAATWAALRIGAILLVVAVILASLLFEWTIVAIAAGTIFAWLAYMSLPLILGSVADDTDDAHDAVADTEHEAESNR